MMEKYDSKRYRRSLLARYVFDTLLWLLMLAIIIYRFANEGNDYPGRISMSSLCCIFHMILFRNPGRPVVKVFKALKDDVELRRAWNAEHDERNLQICAKAGIPLMSDTAIVLACIGMLVSIWEWRIGSGIVLASLVMEFVSTSAYWFWYRRLSQEDEEESEEA